jgi:undecaprenyl-diphosphatase
MRDDERKETIGRWLVAISLVLYLSFFCLMMLTTFESVENFDISALESIYVNRSESLLPVFETITLAGSWIGIFAVVAVAVGILLWRHMPKTAAFIGAEVAVIWVLCEWIKLAIKRQRPDLGADVAGLGYSYPSAHTLVGISLYMTLAMVASTFTESRVKKSAIWISASVFCALLGFSRLYLGVHYPTDVLGGALLGAAWVILMREVWIKYVRPL